MDKIRDLPKRGIIVPKNAQRPDPAYFETYSYRQKLYLISFSDPSGLKNSSEFKWSKTCEWDVKDLTPKKETLKLEMRLVWSSLNSDNMDPNT